MRRVLPLLTLLAALGLVPGCSQDVFESGTEFVCESSADCAQGFECAQTATSDVPICVPASRVGDAGELCNDGNPPQTFFEDSDGDGFGDPKSTAEFCVPEDGFVENSRDCDDANPAVNPEADEICNGADNDCDGRADRPAEGERTCPELIHARLPGDIAAWELATAPDGGAYVSGEYQGTIELGDETLTSQSRASVIFRLESDGTVGWITELSSPGLVADVPLVATDEHVVALLAVTDSIEVGDLSIPGLQDAFMSRLVLAVLDAENGEALSYQQITSVDGISNRSLAIDADGELWLAAEWSGDIDIDGQTTINGGVGRTAVPIEFELSDSGLTYQRHAAWRIGGEGVVPLGLETTPDGAYIAGRVTPASGPLTGHLAFFDTAAGTLDFSAQTARVERYSILAMGAQRDNDARLCGDFRNTVTLGSRTFASEGGTDVAYAGVDHVAGQALLTVNPSTSVSSEANVSCFDFDILGDGSDISAYLITTTFPFEIEGEVYPATPELSAELVVGRDSSQAVDWVRRLESTASIGINRIGALANDRFVVVGSMRGRLRVDGEWLGEEDEPEGFLLIYRKP